MKDNIEQKKRESQPHLVLLKRHGKLLRYWYMRYLNIKKGRTPYFEALCDWEGTPPQSGSALDTGDANFERSRERARGLMEKRFPELFSDKDKTEAEFEHLTQIAARHTLRMRYNESLNFNVIAKPKSPGGDYPLWRDFLKKIGGIGVLKCAADQKQRIKRRLEVFSDFILERHGTRKEPLEGISKEDLQSFLDYLQNDLRFTSNTWNKYLVTLRLVFKKLVPYSEGYKFLTEEVKRRKKDTISREIFSNEEIMSIIAMADQLGYPLIKRLVILAVCTGLRLVDICLLKWENVDLRKNTINLLTHKTGGEVFNFPMWPLLSTILRELKAMSPRTPSPQDYVLPEAADQYKRNPSALLDRLHRVFLALGYSPTDDEAKAMVAADTENNQLECNCLDLCEPKETLERVKAALASDACDWSEYRKNKGLHYLEAYLAGQSIIQIASAEKKSAGGISVYLKKLSIMAGVEIIRQPLWKRLASRELHGGLRSGSSAQRAKAASLRGWHSFRGSFVMAAKEVGADMDAIKKALGSKSVEVILEHYVKATPQFMNKGIGQHVPDFALATAPAETERTLVNATPLEERNRLAVNLLKRVKTLTPENANELRNELLKILED
jgi:integrase